MEGTHASFDEAVRAYWEDPSTVSIIDKNLHELEIATVSRHLLPTDHVADVGCGDGQATVRYAAKVRSCVGIERSSTLRRKAEEARASANVTNLTIRNGDVLAEPELRHEYDVVITQRVLINLASSDYQRRALVNIHRMLKPGGRYLMVENTNDAFDAMNEVRGRVGLPPIPQHWHNRFLDYEELMRFLRGKFQVLKHYDFGLYYLLTRVYLQMFASFEGYGAKAVKDPIFEVADRAARLLFEQMGDRVRIGGYRAFGPIQLFVLRREGHELSPDAFQGG